MGKGLFSRVNGGGTSAFLALGVPTEVSTPLIMWSRRIGSLRIRSVYTSPRLSGFRVVGVVTSRTRFRKRHIARGHYCKGKGQEIR